MLRTPKQMLVTTVILLLAILFFGFSSMFDKASNISLEGLAAEQPFGMTTLPGALRDDLGEDLIKAMRDHWGFMYPASVEPIIDNPTLNKETTDLTRALNEYGSDNPNLSRVLVYLDRAYQTYRPKIANDTLVKKGMDVTEGQDFFPQTEDEMVLYGLYRYNRAHAMFDFSTQLLVGDAKKEAFLKLGFYNMRRAVGAFEQLGKDGRPWEPYWGSFSQAWEGATLDKHGSFPIHHAYANLSTAYLRLADLGGYPNFEREYFRKQEKLYAISGTELSAIVSALFQKTLSERRPSTKIWRLAMALQNLEAAGRGMKADKSEALFNYMIAIILCHLEDLDDRVTFEQAIGFLEMAMAEMDHQNPPAPAYAAQKELALIYLELADDEKFLELMAQIKAAPIRDTITGPHRDTGLLFTDMAQFSAYAQGDLKGVLDHLRFRQTELEQGKPGQEILDQYDSVVATLAGEFFRDLDRRCHQLRRAGQLGKVGYLLQQLRDDPNLAEAPRLQEAFIKQCLRPQTESPGVAVNLWLYDHGAIFLLVRLAPFLLLLILAGYLYWCYRSHQAIASRLLVSRYKEES